jgi:hypothetical protein
VKKRRPVFITLIALFQIVPVLILPPRILMAMDRWMFAIPAALFAVIGWALYTLQPMARTTTIFIQGFSSIIRLLITLAKVVPSKAAGTPADTMLLATTVLSMLLSVLILLYVDQPETQLLFES